MTYLKLLLIQCYGSDLQNSRGVRRPNFELESFQNLKILDVHKGGCIIVISSQETSWHNIRNRRRSRNEIISESVSSNPNNIEYIDKCNIKN